MSKKIINIDPIAKPRMTRRDRWRQRPIVEKYWTYRDLLRATGVRIYSHGQSIEFIIGMPQSWSKKKKIKMRGQPHQQKPDLDNLLKGFLDAILTEDCWIWQIDCRKTWGDIGQIIITTRRK